jgi:hypothetical protein
VIAIEVTTTAEPTAGYFDLDSLCPSLLDRYIPYMRNLMIGLAILGVFVAIVFVFSVVENEGCLPWQTPVGTDNSPFSGNQDSTSCR